MPFLVGDLDVWNQRHSSRGGCHVIVMASRCCSSRAACALPFSCYTGSSLPQEFLSHDCIFCDVWCTTHILRAVLTPDGLLFKEPAQAPLVCKNIESIEASMEQHCQDMLRQPRPGNQHSCCVALLRWLALAVARRMYSHDLHHCDPRSTRETDVMHKPHGAAHGS